MLMKKKKKSYSIKHIENTYRLSRLLQFIDALSWTTGFWS